MRGNRPTQRRRTCAGLTQAELLVVVVGLLVLVALVILPSVVRVNRPATRIACVSNLKMIGLAARGWAVDAGGFPWQLPEAKGGTSSHAEDASFVWGHFSVLSNHLSTPRPLICPKDKARKRAETWALLATQDRNSAVSYSLGLDTSEQLPKSLLSSDRNLTVGGEPVSERLLYVRTNTVIDFGSDIHERSGNVLLGDGSVLMLMPPKRLQEPIEAALQEQQTNQVRLLVP